MRRGGAPRSLAAALAGSALGGSLLLAGSPAFAALGVSERAVLVRYLDALEHGQYAAAFAQLSPAERRYFGSAKNFASGFLADRLTLGSYKIVASTTVPKAGVVALVLERVRFFDHAHQAFGTVKANVQYGIVPNAKGVAIKDPYHPWRVVAPANWSFTARDVRATVRKISFFTGRVELVTTFANLGNDAVTILPYGRSLARDENAKSYAPIATKLPGLTDKTLFEGLRLPGSGQYTGTMSFLTPDRFAPRRLSVTFAPVLTDGADAPFELVLPPLEIAAP